MLFYILNILLLLEHFNICLDWNFAFSLSLILLTTRIKPIILDHLFWNGDFPDFRAGEKTLQLIVQAAGRAGRAELAGQVLMQTFRQEHPVLEQALSYDFQAFAEKELAFRRLHAYPPFTRMILCEFSSSFESDLRQLELDLRRYCQAEAQTNQELFKRLRLLGPSVPALARLRSQYRLCLICLGTKVVELQAFVRSLKEQSFLRASRLRLRLDVDPQNLI